jgi:hypothetical protein
MRFSDMRFAAAAIAVAVGAGACGAGHGAGEAGNPRTASAAQRGPTDPSANPVAVLPVAEADLAGGPAAHQITETIVAFYRAAWQNQPVTACGMFSHNGVAGFLRAARVSFPESVNRYSTCTHAMEIYSATLGDSAANTVAADPTFSTASLDNVGVAFIHVAGGVASAVAPTNVAELIKPKRISLVRDAGRWRIDSSKSLNASNLKQILQAARARGALSAHK